MQTANVQVRVDGSSGVRRRFVRTACVVVMAALVASACGSTAVDAGSEVAQTSSTSPATSTPIVSSAEAVLVSERSRSTADPSVAGQAITSFGLDLFGPARNSAPTENVTLSPTSIAIALAMVEPGATGEAKSQLADVLHIDDPAVFHPSMNALEQELESRVLRSYGPDQDAGELTLRIANAAYLQAGYPFEAEYLDIIGSNYGPALNEVDFASDPAAVAHEINDWVADQTEDRITDLLSEDAVRPETVLALVNALYMNASWLEPFNEAQTANAPFTLLDGTTTDVPLMNGTGNSSSSGDGWVGATKLYTGGLYIQFILPDEGRFEEVANRLPAVIESYPDGRTSGTTLAVPNFESRTGIELTPSLNALGLTAPYMNGNLLGIADDPTLAVDKVLHETFIAIDEQGTEAAASTVVLVTATSGPRFDPVPVILDRPFLYRIMDAETDATLFIGQIVNPTAS